MKQSLKKASEPDPSRHECEGLKGWAHGWSGL